MPQTTKPNYWLPMIPTAITTIFSLTLAGLLPESIPYYEILIRIILAWPIVTYFIMARIHNGFFPIFQDKKTESTFGISGDSKGMPRREP